MSEFIENMCETIATLQAENAGLSNKCERLKMEAEGHAMEARTANSTINAAYQAVTGKTGEPGTWNGERPIVECIEGLRSENERLVGLLTDVSDYNAGRTEHKINAQTTWQKLIAKINRALKDTTNGQ